MISPDQRAGELARQYEEGGITARAARGGGIIYARDTETEAVLRQLSRNRAPRGESGPAAIDPVSAKMAGAEPPPKRTWVIDLKVPGAE
jgi:hypothetical protein